MYKELLPIGSIVSIKEAKRHMMICGRVVTRDDSDQVYDYVGCLFPEGLADASKMYFFNREAIDECLFKGWENKEEHDFKENVLGRIKSVEVVDGKVIPKV